jgi:hypothetical protein
VLEHRLIVKPELQVRGVTAKTVLEDIMRTVEVPVLERAR